MGQQDVAGVRQRGGGQPGAAARAQARLTPRPPSGPGVPAGGPYPGRGGESRAGPSRPGSGLGTAGGEAAGPAAMWGSLGARSESAGPRAASGRLWAVVLGAAAGFFLLGFLIGTVQTNPPSHRGLVQPGDVARSRGRGEERAGLQRPGLCARAGRGESVLSRAMPPSLPRGQVQSLSLSGMSSSSAGERILCLWLVFLFTFCSSK